MVTKDGMTRPRLDMNNPKTNLDQHASGLSMDQFAAQQNEGWTSVT
jgi:hypothetical protein